MSTFILFSEKKKYKTKNVMKFYKMWFMLTHLFSFISVLVKSHKKFRKSWMKLSVI